MMMFTSESVLVLCTTKRRTAEFADSVMSPPPSMVVSAEIVLVAVRTIGGGLKPQSNVTVPPPASAPLSAASVQLADVPVPTVPAAAARPRSPARTSHTHSTVGDRRITRNWYRLRRRVVN
jgi:hypothetical protein